MLDLGGDPSQDAYALACAAATETLGADGWEIGELAVPVHRLRPGASAGWDPHVPLIGWAFPVYYRDAPSHLAIVWGEQCRMEPAQTGSTIHEALEMALGMADIASSRPLRLRIIEGIGIPSSFWIEGEWDAFVPFDEPRVVNSAQFILGLRVAAYGSMHDLVGRDEDEA